MIMEWPMRPDHLRRIKPAPQQSFLMPRMNDPEWARSLCMPGCSTTFTDGDKIIACGGIVPVWSGRGVLWAVFDAEIGPARFVHVTKKIKKYMQYMFDVGFYRLEAYIQTGYPQAERLAVLLGMESEGGSMRRFDGERDYKMFAVVREAA